MPADTYIGDDALASPGLYEKPSALGPVSYDLLVEDGRCNTITRLVMTPAAVVALARALDELRGEAETWLAARAAEDAGDHRLADQLRTEWIGAPGATA